MDSRFRMIDVGEKTVSHRVARASGRITLSPEVCEAIESGTVPKGDVLGLAEIAGICAAKKTPEILPLCHTLLIDAVRVHCHVDRSVHAVLVDSEVSIHGKTGVEMEALAAVSAALLCVYDLTKSLCRGAVIGDIQLEHKSGGRTGEWRRCEPVPKPVVTPVLRGVGCATLTVSDRCANGETEDVSGKVLEEFVVARGGDNSAVNVVPDETELIYEQVRKWAHEEGKRLILITGGTGLSPRDVTPEAIAPLWTKRLPGFGELFRGRSIAHTPRAWLSRAEAGLVGAALVVLLPGSPSGVADGLAVLDEMLLHILAIAEGGRH